MITLAAIPLKNCRQCSHYRGGFCYGFGTAKQVFSESEAILCGIFTPLGQVQIGPLDSLAGQLKEYQIPSGIISTLKLADLAVTVGKLAASSVINSKVAGDAGIIESKLSLDYGTDALNDLIDANDIDIASNLALILLREEFANKDQASGYLGLDAGAKVPLSKLNPLGNAQIAVAAAIAESKLNLAHGTEALNTLISTNVDDIATNVTDIGTNVTDIASNLTAILLREESANKGIASGYCDLDAGVHIPLTRLADLTNSQLAVAAGIIESKLNLDFSTQSLHDDIQTRVTSAQAVAAVEAKIGLTLAQQLTVTSNIICKHTDSLQRDVTGSRLGLLSTPTWNDGICLNLYDGVEGARVFYDGVLIFHIDSVGNVVLLAGKTIDGVDVSEEPARISTEIDSDITTHAGIASAHHAQSHTLASHSSKAHSELMDVTADQHHAQAHTLASHSSKAHSELTDVNPSDHHTAYTDAMALAAVDEHLVLESANATWINCPFEGAADVASDKMTNLGPIQPQGNVYLIFSVPLPTNRGGKKLYINGTRVSLMNADASNEIAATYINGYGNSTKTTLDTDPTIKDSIGLHEDISMTEDLGPYHVAKVALSCAVATPGNLHIQFVTVRYYYA